MLPLNILIAPSGFKESLGPDQVADCIAEGVLRAMPDAHIQKAPLVDGGEGFSKALVAVTGGTLHPVTVTGPVGEPVEASYGILGGVGPRTAVLEMASAAGLRLVPEGRRNPLNTTTYGVGELIRAALDTGTERILIGCADSGTNDGGAGMAQALGAQLLDAAGKPIGWGGKELLKLKRVDLSRMDPRLRGVRIDAACNFNSVLCGPNSVSRIFGPQKGASPVAVELLVQAVERYADIIEQQLGIDVRTMPGGGAAGGLGAGLHVFLNARLHHRYEIVLRYLDLDTPLSKANLVITAEGCIDFTTARGKIPCEVARRAKVHDLPVVAVAGIIGRGAEETLQHGVDAFTSIVDAPMQLSVALYRGPELLKQAAEQVMRTIMVGAKLRNRLEAYEKQVAENGSNSSESHYRGNLPSVPLTTLSQDLRTSLSLVIAYSKMIKDGLLGSVSPSQERALQQVIKHSYGLLMMIHGQLQSASISEPESAARESELVSHMTGVGEDK